jgi:hypothetical protein
VSSGRSTNFLRLKSRVEEEGAEMLRISAVGRISLGENDAKAIHARKLVPPVCAIAAYTKDTVPNSSVSMTRIPQGFASK